MLKKKRFIAPTIIFIGLVIFLILKKSQDSEGTNILVNVSQGEFVVEINTTGELEARNSKMITGPGNLRKYRIWQVKIQRIIDEGTYVKKGQYIATLDASELTNRIKDTELDLEEKESRFIQTRLDTTLQLREIRDQLINHHYDVEEKKFILEQSQFEPQSKIKQAEINLEKAERALKQLEESYQIKKQQNAAKMREAAVALRQEQMELNGMSELLKEFTINAPDDGMLIYRKGRDGRPMKEGSEISAWDPTVATLPDLTSMNSVTYVNEVDIRKVKIGQKVIVGLDAFPEKRLEGTVTRVANVGEQRPNTDAKVFQVTVEVTRSDQDLRPGMTTSNKILTKVVEDALFVPLECLHNYNDTITYVFRKVGISYEKKEVQIGETNEISAQVLLGLKPDDEVYLSIPSGDEGNIELLPELNGLRAHSKKKEEAGEEEVEELSRTQRVRGGERKGPKK